MNTIVENLKMNDKSPVFYQYYPRLFRAYFPEVEQTLIRRLSDTGYIYYHSLLLLDDLIDDKKVSSLAKMILLQEEAIKSLSFIYGKDSEFWFYWEKRKKEYFDAVKIEKGLHYQNANWEMYADLADKKSAFGKIAIDCLFVLSDKKYQLYEALIESHKWFSIGFQLYDDIKDFKEDIQRQQFNWAVYELNCQLSEEEKNTDILTRNKLLYIRGVGQKILSLSISYFEKAAEVLNKYAIESEWIDVIRKNKITIASYLHSAEGYLNMILKKIELQNQKQDCEFFAYEVKDGYIQNGLTYIKLEYNKGYAELKHIMYLSKYFDDFSNSDEIHCTDIFQRTIINDCILDIAEKYNLNCIGYMKAEVEYILTQRNQDAVGGWSYFPTVREIAPDIDDLGQIIQFLIRTKNRALIETYCNCLIEIALKNKYNKKGGIATWIIPNEERTEIQERQVFFNETKWGCGPDVEVVANFIYALHRYDAYKYKNIIDKAIEYIIDNQNEDSYWESRWYYGNYYGTYVCLRLLHCYEDERTCMAIEACKRYLVYAQNEDGGYGMGINENSDSLSTAFALLSLKLYSEELFIYIQKAECFLKKNQQKEGFWEASDFIKPKADKPYRSRVVTTAIVLKSLIK